MKRSFILILVFIIALSTLSALADNIYKDKPTVKKVQQALNDAGYNCGKPDGIAGKNTYTAIENYQKDNGLEVTRQIDDALLMALGLAETPNSEAFSDETVQSEDESSDIKAHDSDFDPNSLYDPDFRNILCDPEFFLNSLNNLFKGYINALDNSMRDSLREVGATPEDVYQNYRLDYPYFNDETNRAGYPGALIQESSNMTLVTINQKTLKLENNTVDNITYISLDFFDVTEKHLDDLHFNYLRCFLMLCDALFESEESSRWDELDALFVKDETGTYPIPQVGYFNGHKSMFISNNYFVTCWEHGSELTFDIRKK